MIIVVQRLPHLLIGTPVLVDSSALAVASRDGVPFAVLIDRLRGQRERAVRGNPLLTLHIYRRRLLAFEPLLNLNRRLFLKRLIPLVLYPLDLTLPIELRAAGVRTPGLAVCVSLAEADFVLGANPRVLPWDLVVR